VFPKRKSTGLSDKQTRLGKTISPLNYFRIWTNERTLNVGLDILFPQPHGRHDDALRMGGKASTL
jgi:hypothetical protein